jgi:hypothetical protein
VKGLKVSAVVLSSLITVACGGGGGGGGGDSSTPASVPAPAQGGVVTPTPVATPVATTAPTVTPFVSSASIRTLYSVNLTRTSGASKQAVTQDARGVVTKFGDYMLEGSYAAQEVSGSAHYAIGRWSAGTVSAYNSSSNATTATDLSKFSNGAAYYVTLNSPATALANYNGGNFLSCTETHATKPVLSSSSSGAPFANTANVSNGSVKFDATGNATVEFTVNAATGTTAGATTYTSTIRWVSTAYNGFNLLGIKGQQGQSSSIGYLDLGTNGDNGVIIGSIYTIMMADQSSYQGSLVMVCK